MKVEKSVIMMLDILLRDFLFGADDSHEMINDEGVKRLIKFSWEMAHEMIPDITMDGYKDSKEEWYDRFKKLQEERYKITQPLPPSEQELEPIVEGPRKVSESMLETEKWVGDYIEEHGYAPTYQNVADSTGLYSKSHAWKMCRRIRHLFKNNQINLDPAPALKAPLNGDMGEAAKEAAQMSVDRLSPKVFTGLGWRVTGNHDAKGNSITFVDAISELETAFMDGIRYSEGRPQKQTRVKQRSGFLIITPKTLSAEKYVDDFIEKNNKAPSYRQVANHFGLKGKGAVYHRLRRYRDKMSKMDFPWARTDGKPAEEKQVREDDLKASVPAKVEKVQKVIPPARKIEKKKVVEVKNKICLQNNCTKPVAEGYNYCGYHK